MSKATEVKRRISKSKDERHALVRAENRSAIAFELRAMLDDRGWTQTRLAHEAGMKQSQISTYLRGYDQYSLGTLRKLGEAFDVALLVTYVAFDEFVDRMSSKTEADLAVPEATRVLTAGGGIITSVRPNTAWQTFPGVTPITQQLPLIANPGTATIVPIDRGQRGTRSSPEDHGGTASDGGVKEYAIA